MKRIVCIGNRYRPEDDAGPRVYSLLRGSALPDGVEAIDGGMSGLDLLASVERAERVVFVDCVSGFGRAGEVLVLDPEEVATAASPRYDHAAGLPYLLRVLPAVCDGPAPEVIIVGIEGRADGAAVAAAAELALKLARGEPVRGGAQ